MDGVNGQTGSPRRGGVASVLIGLIVTTVAGAGCAGETRPERSKEQLLQAREVSNAQLRTATRDLVGKLFERTKRQYDDYKAGRRPDPPVIDFLIISGGGDWGAFGSGFLKGWQQVPKSDPLAMPEFDVVTGVSTGALIAPFAFVGDAESLDRVVTLYRNPKPDWARKRGPLYFLPHHISFAEVPGLERELKANVTADLVRRIAEAGADGRALAVNTTNVDDGVPRVWDLVAEARAAADTGNLDRIHDVMLASAGIPGVFPFRVIDGEMFVDGGVTGNVIYGGRVAEEDSLPAVWQKAHPGVPIPKLRYWVVFNNQLRPPPRVVEPNWPDVISRSMEMSVRASTLTSLRHLHAMAEISRLKRQADVEVRTVAIPGDWAPPMPGAFVKETMNDLADLGERMGADPAGSWSADPPPP